MAYTNDKSLNSKVDNGRSLAGNENIPNPLATHGVDVHLRYSPASGPGEFTEPFHLGHRWSEVDGKIQAQSGKTAI